jgi:hypothetical protein
MLVACVVNSSSLTRTVHHIHRLGDRSGDPPVIRVCQVAFQRHVAPFAEKRGLFAEETVVRCSYCPPRGTTAVHPQPTSAALDSGTL